MARPPGVRHEYVSTARREDDKVSRAALLIRRPGAGRDPLSHSSSRKYVRMDSGLRPSDEKYEFLEVPSIDLEMKSGPNKISV